jgi:hypothetical protein
MATISVIVLILIQDYNNIMPAKQRALNTGSPL